MKKVAIAFVALLGLGGCSNGEATGTGTMKLQGTVPAGVRNLDNARAVAISRSGRTYWSYLDARGDFTLTLPAGDAYRMLVTSARATGGQRAVGHLIIDTSKGPSAWIGVHDGGTLDLGKLNLATTPTGGGLKPQDEGGSDSSSSTGGASSGSDDHHGDDFDCHEDDHESDEVCDEQDGDDGDKDVELHAEHDPQDRCIDDFDHSKSGSSTDDKSGGSTDSSSGDKSGSSSDDKSDDDEHEPVCPPPGGGGGGAGGGTGAGGASSSSSSSSSTSSSSTGSGSTTCNVSADCGANKICVASQCQAVPL